MSVDNDDPKFGAKHPLRAPEIGHCWTQSSGISEGRSLIAAPSNHM